MKKRFRVTLPIEVGGKIFNFGETIEMELEEAAKYSHALIAVDEPEVESGRDS